MTALFSSPALVTPATLTRDAGCSLVIGNFDGVHRGHQALIAAARAVRPEHRVVVLSFEPHPREFFAQARGAAAPAFRLTLAARKTQLLHDAGADAVALMGFDLALSAMTADDFIRSVIIDGIGAGHVFIGAGFAFGAGRGGSVATLQAAGAQYGFGVTALEPVCDASAVPYASSRVRDAVACGDFAGAADLLGYDWCVTAPVVTGEQRGRTLGFPTANQNLDRLQLPPYGIYAVRLRIEGDSVWRDGVANLGIRPMFAVVQPLLETFIFDFTGDIYGKTMDVIPVAFIRGEAHFDSLDALMAQMKQDCQAARAMLKSHSL